LERSEVATSSSETAAKEVIVIIESHSTAHAAHHAEISKWISLSNFISTSVASLLILSCETHIHLHSHATHLRETSAEKVIVVIEKAGEWISASEEVLKYFFSTVHVEVVEITRLEMEVLVTSVTATSLQSIFSIHIVVFSFLLITQYSVGA
jgi:hypothetical protein